MLVHPRGRVRPAYVHRAPAVAWAALLTLAAGIAVSQEPRALPSPVVGDVSLESQAKIDELIVQDYPLEATLRVEPTRSRLVRTRRPVARLAITHPEILEVTQYGPTEFEFIGKKSGETTLTLWFAGERDEPTVLRYLVVVSPDTSITDRAALEYADLRFRERIVLKPRLQESLQPATLSASVMPALSAAVASSRD